MEEVKESKYPFALRARSHATTEGASWRAATATTASRDAPGHAAGLDESGERQGGASSARTGKHGSKHAHKQLAG